MSPFRSPVLAGASAAGLLVALASWLAPANAEEVPPPAPKPGPEPTRCVAEPEPTPAPSIEVVFVVDTTGSMGGLIEGAKRKVWSIANEILSGTPRPRLSVGLIAYRDRGDAYVTQVTQPTEDLDAVYAQLRGFRAQGGGDGPEHVNYALNDAFNTVQWSQQSQLKLVYLVGDAPAHRDYDRQMDYAKIVPAAREQGIIVNAALCGKNRQAAGQFREIARLGGGEYFEIAQNGGMQAMSTPYDARLRKLQRELEETRVAYGSKQARERAAEEKARVLSMEGEAAAARASAVAKLAPGAPAQAESDLVDAFESGRLDEVADEALPEELRGASKAERAQKVQALASRRARVERELAELSKKRDGFVRSKAPKDGFDARVLESLKEKAAEAGIEYGK